MAQTWQAMWNIVKAKFPDAILTSAYRPGDPGYHGKGQAIDIARPYPAESARMLEFARWIGANYPHSTQLIHTPGPNILNGRPFTYDAPTQRDHYNHVHWAMANMPVPSEPVKPSTGSAFPLPPGHYFGLITGPDTSHGGANPVEQSHVMRIQQALIRKGYVPGVTDPNAGWADGVFEGATAEAVERFQRAEMPGTTRFGEVWADDWAKLLLNISAPTPPPKGGTVALPSSSRNGTPVIWVCLHTAEGSRRTGDLFAFFNRNQNASSHAGVDGYGLSDGWVHPSRAAWTLLNGNPRSMNLEICGFARWTRAQWLSEGTVDGCYNPRNMVRLAAKWAKQECERFGIPKTHIGINGVRARARGVIMHDDYSKGANDGTHWDVGKGFPWDVFFADMGIEEDDMPSAEEVAKATWDYILTNARDGHKAKAHQWLVGNAAALGRVEDELRELRASLDTDVWETLLPGDPLPDGTPYATEARTWLVDRARVDEQLKVKLDSVLAILEEAKAEADKPA